MESTVVVAILSLVGTLGGSIIAGIVSNNKTLYRIEQLERKVEKHNSFTTIQQMKKIYEHILFYCD